MAIQILTWTGIVILCVLLLFVSFFCMIFFSPIHYEITGGKESDNIFCKLKGHFFFKKIKFLFSYTYGVEPIWRLKVFKKTYRSRKKKPVKKKSTPAPEQTIDITREKKTEILLDTNILEIETEETVSFPSSIDLAQLKKEHNLDGQEIKRVKLKDVQPVTTPPQQTKTLFDFHLKIPSAITDFFQKIKTMIGHAKTLKQQIKNLWGKRDIWHALKKLLKKLLHHMKADQLSIVAKIGFSDPAVTGQFMGLVSILIGKYGDNVLITPDFAKENFEDIEVYAKGRIFICHFVHSFLQFICHPSIRAQIKAYRKGRKENG
ncbi:MAG: DUF2953 domain-containing protein [Bacillota bacterium]